MRHGQGLEDRAATDQTAGNVLGRTRRFVARYEALLSTLIAVILVTGVSAPAKSQQPSWINSGVIYCVYPEIFSSSGFRGVTAQLSRLQGLGVNVLWLMPVTPVGLPFNGHPAFDSPYAVHDYYAVNPNYGTSSDLTNLVNAAHSLGMKVILDEVLNHTSWDNALTTEHPEYYRHSDGNPNNPNSEEEAFNFADVAQLDYSNPSLGLWTYMQNMLSYWITTYNVDGFRFDTADNPPGSSRNIPQAFWQQLSTSLLATKPNILLLGEEEDAALALAPFGLDYGWNLQGALVQAATSGNSASGLQSIWQNQVTGWPTGMLHMSLTQDWDLGEDLQVYGGVPNTLDAAVFNYTINGVPLLFNGEEVGNDASGNNTHTAIDWTSRNASVFTSFYSQLIALRNANPALQQGTLTWETNSAPAQVATYVRTSGSTQFLVEINFSNTGVNGTVSLPAGNSWTDVTPSGSPGGKSHAQPGTLALAPYDFAIFKSSTSVTPPAAPTNLIAVAGSGQVSLSWNASSAAASYNVYRGTAAGAENGTAVATGITSTSYTDTGLSNGTTYYYKVAAVNGAGTSSLSGESFATPSAAMYTGLPYLGTPAAIPGTIDFDNYDIGGQGIAYNDSDPTNDGGAYRPSEGVDIEPGTDSNGIGNGYDVGWVEPGEWAKYTVNVASSSGYTVNFRVASGTASGTAGSFHLEDETGANLTGAITVASTGGWQSWTTLNGAVTLTAGNHVLRIVIDSGNGSFNLEYMSFSVPAAYTGTSWPGAPVVLPGIIQAENYDSGGRGVAYYDTDVPDDGGQYRTSESVDIESCTDTGGGYDVGWIETGEWLKYSVTVQTSRTYAVTARVASGIAGGTAGTFHIEDESGTNLSGPITVNATGGWQTWTNVTANVNLTAGSHVLRVYFDSANGSFNVNYISFN
jgi:glycosidase